MTRCACITIFALAGCDSLFSLVHVPEPRGDAQQQQGDGPDRDATLDGKPGLPAVKAYLGVH